MTITIGVWIIPVLITVVLLCIMLRPYHSSGDYDFGAIARIVWLFPIMATWIIYLSIMLWMKK